VFSTLVLAFIICVSQFGLNNDFINDIHLPVLMVYLFKACFVFL